MTTSPSNWKIVVLKFVAFGAGFAIMAGAIAAGALWYSRRPRPEKPWNQSAIKASSYTQALASIESDRAVGDFRYTLQNTTDRDYKLPADATIMVRLAQDMSYREVPDMTSDHNLYIPAGQKVNVSITLPIRYSDYNFSKAKADDDKQLAPFMNSRLAEIDGFVLFDPTNRYKVDFPNGWPESVKRAKEAEAKEKAGPKALVNDAK
jgi:hypothetical protein